ncbi:MAG: MarR family transcriptional regulator [Pseudomonadota bacterium]
MVQAEQGIANFAYGPSVQAVCDPAGLPARVVIFAERARRRDELAEDLDSAGFRTIDGGALEDLIDGPITLMGDVVLVDCPTLEARELAGLIRLDMRAARTGAHLIISTSLKALDDVFAALDQSAPQILVQPSRAERLVAVGRVLAELAPGRVREMSENDRLSLLHLSREVEAIAHKLEGLSDHQQAFEQPMRSEHAPDIPRASTAAPLFNSARAALPDPRFVRRVIAARQARARFFDAELFADPAWDMLLDLTAAHAEQAQVSVTSLCIAAGVPATTALRWLKQMVESGIFERVDDPSDKRRAFIVLSEQSLEAMARYFAEVETPLAEAA